MIQSACMRTIVVAAMLCLGSSRGYATSSDFDRALTQIRRLEEALQLYELEVGRLPTKEEGLRILSKPPASGKPFVLRIPNDPWGNPYRYNESSAAGMVSSDGPDGQPGTKDDIMSTSERPSGCAVGL